jgi:hypothetical protein
MLSVLGVVQGLTDCEILIDWLPDMFNGDCCRKTYSNDIKCSDGRITKM